MEKKEIEELAKFIREHASFDGSDNDKCPHCKTVIKYGHYYFDHKWSLSHDIATYLNKGEWVAKYIETIFEGLEYTNDEKPNYAKIAQDILKNI